MFTIAIYVATSGPGICVRLRLPRTFATASDAAAAGVAHLRDHPMAIGFEVEPPGLGAANDTAIKRQRVQRAIAARKAKQTKKGGDHEL